MARTFVAYLRANADNRVKPGLDLEAQNTAIAAFLERGIQQVILAPPFVELESGRNSDRPKLREAMERCRKTGATLLIACLDRLAHNCRFISELMEGGVPFVACDMPMVTPFTLHIYAAMAEEQSRAISHRTKAALAKAKARGVKLGGDRGYRPTKAPDGRLGGDAVRLAADRTAIGVMVVIEQIRAVRGANINQSALARALTERGVPTPRGGAWDATTVRRVIARV